MPAFECRFIGWTSDARPIFEIPVPYKHAEFGEAPLCLTAYPFEGTIRSTRVIAPPEPDLPRLV